MISEAFRTLISVRQISGSKSLDVCFHIRACLPVKFMRLCIHAKLQEMYATSGAAMSTRFTTAPNLFLYNILHLAQGLDLGKMSQ